MHNAVSKTDRTLPRTVAIIGAGSPAGSKLALLFARAGCRVQLSDADPAAAARTRMGVLQAHIRADVETLACERTSCWESDLIVIAEHVPLRSHIIDRIRDVATGKIVLTAGHAVESAAVLRTRMPHAQIVSLADDGVILASGNEEARATIKRLLDAGKRGDRRRMTKAA